MLYFKEINRALKYYFNTQNAENFGWSWVRDISPNVQNTAEVIYCCCLFVDSLDRTEKDFVNEAAEYWLMFPSLHAAITIDWIWVGMALIEYKRKWGIFNPVTNRSEDEAKVIRQVAMNKIDAAINLCAEKMKEFQNDDGGWADNKGDVSTVIRTAAVLVFLSKIETPSSELCESVRRGRDWLVRMQNDDGGWGNIRPSDFRLDDKEYGTEITVDVIDEQFESNASATGYAIYALAELNRINNRPFIKRGITRLEAMISCAGDYGIFYEVGMRRETVFTYRHFGTVWATLGLLSAGDQNALSDGIRASVKYILSLQDPISGGFKCTENSGVYTWSTVNALMFLYEVGKSIENLAGIEYTDIILDYIRSKAKKENNE